MLIFNDSESHDCKVLMQMANLAYNLRLDEVNINVNQR